MKSGNMKTDNELRADELSLLEQQYQAELPQILMESDENLELAIEALDRYLARNPPADFQKNLLTWKGRFYLEHERYEDAIRELRAADELPFSHELANFNTKFDLAIGLENSGDLRGAYTVLTKALNEIEAPSLFLNLLAPLARLAADLDLAMPARSQAALKLAKQFYGIDSWPEEEELSIEVPRLLELVRDASAGYGHLHVVLPQIESPAERVELVEAYLDGVSIPYFKGLAENLLRRVRQEAETKS